MSALQLVAAESLGVRAVRHALGIWSDLLVSMMAAERALRGCGQGTQADALRADIDFMRRRAMRSLKRLSKETIQ